MKTKVLAALLCVSALLNAHFLLGHVKARLDLTLHPHYLARRSIYAALPAQPLAFVGDSITEHGRWTELLDRPTSNFGIAGDTSSGLLHRISDVTKTHPKKLFLMIGVNDLLGGETPEAVAHRYAQILARIHAESPGSRVFVQSVLPVGQQPAVNKQIGELNALLATLSAQTGAEFVNLNPKFRTPDGLLAYSFDGLHLSGDGYRVWAQAIASFTGSTSAKPPQVYQ